MVHVPPRFATRKAQRVNNVHPARPPRRAAFRVFDADGSGLIDAGELERGLRGLGEALGDDGTLVEQLFEEYDIERTGQINYAGFVRLMISTGA